MTAEEEDIGGGLAAQNEDSEDLSLKQIFSKH